MKTVLCVRIFTLRSFLVDTCFVTRWWGGGLIWTVHATLSLERWSFRWRQFECSFVFFSRKNVSNRPSFFSAPFSIRCLAISMNSLKRTVKSCYATFSLFFPFWLFVYLWLIFFWSREDENHKNWWAFKKVFKHFS